MEVIITWSKVASALADLSSASSTRMMSDLDSILGSSGFTSTTVSLGSTIAGAGAALSTEIPSTTVGGTSSFTSPWAHAWKNRMKQN